MSHFALAWKLALSFWIASMLVGCGNDDGEHQVEQPASPEFGMFFENSTRRDPTQLERDQTISVNGCAAFFVRNNTGKNLLMSARHCFNRAITRWCGQQGRVVDNDGQNGTCQRIVAADVGHDIALFEVTLPYVAESGRGLRLASFSPGINTRLKMIGYPADQYRHAALTVTENCWILAEDAPSPHDAQLGDRSARHNCTTYGGNSGGPMLQEGTDIAVGLPFTYAPNDYHERSATDITSSSHMAKMADFVAVHRKELDAEGVDLAATATAAATDLR